MVRTDKDAPGPVPDVEMGEPTPGKPKALSRNKTDFVSGYKLTRLPPLTILPVVHALQRREQTYRRLRWMRSRHVSGVCPRARRSGEGAVG